MRLESDAEVAVGFVALIVFAVLIVTAGVALFHNGYYQGKSECQSNTNTTLQKDLIKEETK